MIHEARIEALNDRRIRKGRYVLYWMQASQRVEYNHALEYAIERANELGLPLLVFFGITDDFPEANERRYHFMLEGLKEVKTALRSRGIGMLVLHRRPERGAVDLAGEAALVVADRGYLRIQRKWRERAARNAGCPFIQVESDTVVPVETVSDKEEYAAATIRPKIGSRLEEFLVPLRARRVKRQSLDLAKGSLDGYDQLRNDPTRDCLSGMSPYLHFGQISPLYIALKIKAAGSAGTAAYLEELLVRRELSMNFVYYNANYDSFMGLPEWARKTLAKHRGDKRAYVYTLRQLESAATHDPYWNAAQNEMRLTGKMHGYMRMYWGKKIIEWTRTPEHAFKIALYLNNKYEVDGRDPNGFAGVAWCFGKHDRPWAERPVFGLVRYMNDKGLRRKFDADGYVHRIERLKGSGS
jgi:deoxyribodipyrimidine photo-lyase